MTISAKKTLKQRSQREIDWAEVDAAIDIWNRQGRLAVVWDSFQAALGRLKANEYKDGECSDTKESK